MNRRQDDDSLDDLVSELSTTLTDIQDALADEQGHQRHQRQPRRVRRPPAPGRFLQFTEEYTIPTLISLLETNIRALELFQGLLRLINGRDSRRSDANLLSGNRQVQKTGKRTLGALDSALSDIQGALEGEPTDSEARSLLDDARSLRRDIDNRLSDPDTTRDRTRSDRSDRSNRSTRPDYSDHSNRTDDREDSGAIRIDVTDEATDEDETSETDSENQAPDDGVNIDDELETIKREMQDDDDDDTSEDK